MIKNLLILERSSSQVEFKKTDSGDYILEGIFSIMGKKNKNNRIYDEAEFIPHVMELAEKCKGKKILGELDHPKQFEVSLKNVSHVIEEITYDKASKEVRGRIKLLDTDAGKQAKAKELTDFSTDEQKSAGLNSCTDEEMKIFDELNKSYFDKFNFPYILAVKGRNKKEILENFKSRLGNSLEDEKKVALMQINQIALIRIKGIYDK